MVEPIYFLKPAWCGTHFAGLWPEQGLQPVTRATAFEAVDFTLSVLGANIFWLIALYSYCTFPADRQT